MRLRALPVTGACPYVKNSPLVTGYQALSGRQNCYQRADQGVCKSIFCSKLLNAYVSEAKGNNSNLLPVARTVPLQFRLIPHYMLASLRIRVCRWEKWTINDEQTGANNR